MGDSGLNLSASPPGAPPLPGEQRKPRVLWKWSLIVTAVILLFFGYRCTTGLVTTARAADRVVAEFHGFFNAGQFRDVLSLVDMEYFDDERKQDELLQVFAAVRKRLGPAGESSRQNLNVQSHPTVTYATVVYRTQFEKAPGTETFTFRVSGSRLLLLGYTINSRALIVDVEPETP